MIEIVRTDSHNADFQLLVAELDKDLAVRNGEDNEFFAQFNHVDEIKHVIVAYNDNAPVGCGAIKEYDEHTMEIKRMFVPLPMRGKGVAPHVLANLELWAQELGYTQCVLETGDKMPEAIGLYKKCNYEVIPNYGQYESIESSVCFKKTLHGIL